MLNAKSGIKVWIMKPFVIIEKETKHEDTSVRKKKRILESKSAGANDFRVSNIQLHIFINYIF